MIHHEIASYQSLNLYYQQGTYILAWISINIKQVPISSLFPLAQISLGLSKLVWTCLDLSKLRIESDGCRCT